MVPHPSVTVDCERSERPFSKTGNKQSQIDDHKWGSSTVVDVSSTFSISLSMALRVGMWMNNSIPHISVQKKVVVCLPWNANYGLVKLTAVTLICASIDQISFIFSILFRPRPKAGGRPTMGFPMPVPIRSSRHMCESVT